MWYDERRQKQQLLLPVDSIFFFFFGVGLNRKKLHNEEYGNLFITLVF